MPPPLPATRDFTGQQRYGLAAPGGIGVAAIAGLGGGLGQNVKIVDVEYWWNRSHEDLAKAAPAATLIANGTPADPFNDNNHGTAVLGELIATANKFGVTGLTRGSAIGLANAYASDTGYTPANAVNVARQNLSAGYVILLEQQWQGIPGTGSEAVAYVPSEYLASVYDAVKLATQSGIIVVEAAGNGGVDLDNAAYTAPFPDGKPDSGAIIVGAGSGNCSSPANSRLSFSTYGARLNLQGWGQCVTTTGYGGLFNGGLNARYTAAFNGTSSAAPIVASAAALYSSVFQARAPGWCGADAAGRAQALGRHGHGARRRWPHRAASQRRGRDHELRLHAADRDDLRRADGHDDQRDADVRLRQPPKASLNAPVPHRRRRVRAVRLAADGGHARQR